MPRSYSIDTARRIVVSRGWGVLTGPGLLEHSRSLAADARFDSSFMHLYDLRRVTDIQASSKDLATLAGVSPFGVDARRVSIAASDLAYGLSHMFEMLGERKGDTMHVTRDLDAALLWLGMVQHADAIVAALEGAPDVSFEQ